MNFSQQAKECNYQTCYNFGWLIPITNYYNVTSYITVVTLIYCIAYGAPFVSQFSYILWIQKTKIYSIFTS